MVDKETAKSRGLGFRIRRVRFKTSLGFGFITFASEDSVEKVIERFNENKIDGKWVQNFTPLQKY